MLIRCFAICDCCFGDCVVFILFRFIFLLFLFLFFDFGFFFLIFCSALFLFFVFCLLVCLFVCFFVCLFVFFIFCFYYSCVQKLIFKFTELRGQTSIYRRSNRQHNGEKEKSTKRQTTIYKTHT